MIRGMTPLTIKRWGGLVTVADPLALSTGASPDCADVEFAPGSIRTRSGLSQVLSTGNSKNPLYLKTYTKADNATRRMLLFDSGGNLWKEATEGTLALIQSGFSQVSGIKSCTLYGREFIAMSDGKAGVSAPLQFDDTNLDRVSNTAPGGAPTATANIITAGNIAKGVHFCAVIFVTRSGYLTSPGPTAAWTASGADTVNITNIPVGPANVNQRILVFSRADDPELFWIPGGLMVINDNTTTSVSAIDFVDTTLGAAESVTDLGLLNLVEIPPCSGFTDFNDRLVSWGHRNAIQRVGSVGPLNLDFDGGWNGNIPLGWTQITAGGTRATGVAGSTGDCFQINGANSQNDCKIENSVLAQTYFMPNTEYSVRVRARKTGSSVGGAAAIYTATVGGGEAAGFLIPFASLSSDFQWFEGVVFPSTASMNQDTFFRVSNSTLSNLDTGAAIQIDAIIVFPTSVPVTGSTLYVSNPGDPESIDGLTGFVNVAENNGQRIGTCFKIRDVLYIAKEESLWALTDNGSTPNNWKVDPVSSVAGTPSLYGVGMGEDFAIIAGKHGCYQFTGGLLDDSDLAREIEPTWRRINWAVGEKIWVEVDPLLNRVYIGVPLDTATTNSHVLVMDYTEGFSFPTTDIQQAAGGAGRKWTLWRIAAGCGVRVKRSTLRYEMFFGTLDLSGKVAKLDDAATDDLGAVISSYYWTSFYGGDGGRQLFGYLTMNVSGSGQLPVFIRREDQSTLVALTPWLLFDPSDRDLEGVTNVLAERVQYLLQSDGTLGSYFNIKRLVPWVQESVWSPVAGVNAG